MVIDGQLYCRFDTSLRLVPDRDSLMTEACSTHALAGHPSAVTTQRLLEQTFYHLDMVLIAQGSLLRCQSCSLRIPQRSLGQTLDP